MTEEAGKTPRRYSVALERGAQRQFNRLPRQAQEQLRPVIDALAENPRPNGVIAMKGAERGYYRVRSGDYRVIYAVEDDVLRVLVVRVGNRREVYR